MSSTLTTPRQNIEIERDHHKPMARFPKKKMRHSFSPKLPAGSMDFFLNPKNETKKEEEEKKQKEKVDDHEALMSDIDEVLSGAESIIESRKKRKMRMLRHKFRNRKKMLKKRSFFPKSKLERSVPHSPHKSHRSHHSERAPSTGENQEGEESHSESAQKSHRSSSHSTPRSSANNSGSEQEPSDNESQASAQSSISINSNSSKHSRASQRVEKEELKDPRYMTKNEIIAEKYELLYKLGRLRDSGYPSSLNLNIRSPLDMMRAEVKRLSKNRNVQRSIRFQRKCLVSFASGTEYVNRRFNPYKFQLDGWSGEVLENIGDYDEVFERLYEKYGSADEMSPELKLVLMVGGSGLMFHLSNTLFKSSMPGLDEVFRKRPDLAEQVKQAAMNSMASQHGSNPLFQAMMGGVRMKQQARAPPATFQRTTTSVPQAAPTSYNVESNVQEVPPGQGMMRGPSGVDDILAQLHRADANEASLVSDVESEPEEKQPVRTPSRSRRRRKKADNVIDLDMDSV